MERLRYETSCGRLPWASYFSHSSKVMIYLSVPYSSEEPNVRACRVAAAVRAVSMLMAKGQVTICPVVLNHQAIELLPGGASTLPGVYWRELENRLADACDELVVLRLPGWEESRGVRREMDLFGARSKPVSFMDLEGGDTISESTRPVSPKSDEDSLQ